MLYVELPAVELGIAVQIQNIGEGFYTRPLLVRLDAQAGCQINDTTGTSTHDDEWHEKCIVFRQLATRGAKIQLGKLAVGGFHQPKHKQTFQPGMHIF